MYVNAGIGMRNISHADNHLKMARLGPFNKILLLAKKKSVSDFRKCSELVCVFL